MRRNPGYTVAVDLGSTKICCVVGEVKESGAVDVIGIGRSNARGMRRGAIINLDAAVESLKTAVEEAETMAGSTVEKAFVGFAGAHIRGFNSRGVVAVSGRDREVTQLDVDKVLESARSISLPPDRVVIHVVPQEYTVDDQEGIGDPIGMTGSRLEANVHVVTGSLTAIHNITNCLNRAGIEVTDIVLDQIAVAESVLTQEEKEQGVALVDIGGAATQIAVFDRGALRHTGVVPLGGDLFTGDIAVGLRTPNSEAEQIKTRYGCAIARMIDDDETIAVPSVGGRKPRRLSRQILCEILQPRSEELLSLVAEEIEKSGYDGALGSGVVITGGGSLLEGLVEIGEQIFDAPVRVGGPSGVGGLVDLVSTAPWSTAVGTLLFGASHGAPRDHVRVPWVILGKMFEATRDFFSDVFQVGR
ncbi:MAG TPA: cell division protein FtsA [Candidatus Saccharimonadales bacterium]|nr:cell division protein FtsA [Candidatus Saccharimonadales bacterium]